MLSRLRIGSNKIGGGYPASSAPRVSWGGGRRRPGEFFGEAGSVLALEARLAEAGEGARRHPRRILGNGGNPPFSGGRFGYVARRYVARTGQGLGNGRFSEGRSQIANLTTQRADRAQLAAGGRLPAPIGGWVSPLSCDRATPDVPAVRRSWSWENLSEGRPIAACDRECIPGCGGPESRLLQLGSGVRAAPRPMGSGAKCAESVRRAVGRGEPRAHYPLGAGKSGSLTPLGSRVNEIPQGGPVRLARPPAAGYRAGPRGVQRAPRHVVGVA